LCTLLLYTRHHTHFFSYTRYALGYLEHGAATGDEALLPIEAARQFIFNMLQSWPTESLRSGKEKDMPFFRDFYWKKAIEFGNQVIDQMPIYDTGSSSSSTGSRTTSQFITNIVFEAKDNNNHALTNNTNLVQVKDVGTSIGQHLTAKELLKINLHGRSQSSNITKKTVTVEEAKKALVNHAKKFSKPSAPVSTSLSAKDILKKTMQERMSKQA
jgi:hypothetical protein